MIAKGKKRNEAMGIKSAPPPQRRELPKQKKFHTTWMHTLKVDKWKTHKNLETVKFTFM